MFSGYLMIGKSFLDKRLIRRCIYPFRHSAWLSVFLKFLIHEGYNYNESSQQIGSAFRDCIISVPQKSIDSHKDGW